jgi:integrase
MEGVEMNEGLHIRGRLGGTYYRTGKRGIFQLNYQNCGKEIRESAKTTDESRAAKLLEERLKEIIKCEKLGEIFETPKLRKQTIGSCLDQWETLCKLQNRWNDCYACDKRQLVQRFGSMTADNLTKSVFQQYQLEQKQGLSEAKSLSRNAKLNRQLVILNSAMKIAGITPSYAKQLKQLKLPEPPARQGYFTPAEFRILHSSLPPHIADVVEALWLTGWRLSEICGKLILGKFRPGVLWSEKDGDSLMLPGERSKGRRAKRVPLTGQLKAVIEKRERLKVAGCDLIFCRPNGKPIGDFYRHWKKACAVAGKCNAMVHDLRRSRARNWVRAGVSEAVAMKLAGMRTREVFLRYNVVSEEDMLEAQIQTEQYLEKQTEKQDAAKQISTTIN